MPGRFNRTDSGLPDRSFDTRGQAGSVQGKNIMNSPKSRKRSGEKKLACPRILLLSVIFFCMFARLVVRLYELQIINGEQYLNSYLQMTTRELDFPGVRGNIYDRNGNELAYVVMFRDNGRYKSASEKNGIFLKLVRILNQRILHQTRKQPINGFCVIYLDLNLRNSLPGRMENFLRIFLLRNFSGIGIPITSWMK